MSRVLPVTLLNVFRAPATRLSTAFHTGPSLPSYPRRVSSSTKYVAISSRAGLSVCLFALSIALRAMSPNPPCFLDSDSMTLFSLSIALSPTRLASKATLFSPFVPKSRKCPPSWLATASRSACLAFGLRTVVLPSFVSYLIDSTLMSNLPRYVSPWTFAPFSSLIVGLRVTTPDLIRLSVSSWERNLVKSLAASATSADRFSTSLATAASVFFTRLVRGTRP